MLLMGPGTRIAGGAMPGRAGFAIGRHGQPFKIVTHPKFL
jgi:hypothetical protein